MESQEGRINVLQTMRDLKCQPRSWYTAKIRHFMIKIKVKQYLPTNPALQEALEGKVQTKEISPIQETTRNKESQSSDQEEKHTHIRTHSKIQKSVIISHWYHSTSVVSILPINKQIQQYGCENRIYLSAAPKEHTLAPRTGITSGWWKRYSKKMDLKSKLV